MEKLTRVRSSSERVEGGATRHEFISPNLSRTIKEGAFARVVLPKIRRRVNNSSRVVVSF